MSSSSSSSTSSYSHVEASYSYSHLEAIEICKKGEGFLGCYHPGTLLAAIGLKKYMVRYNHRFASDRTRLLTESVDESEIRPIPPSSSCSSFTVSDRVDAYLDNVWREGKVTRIVKPNYYVRLVCNGDEAHCPFDKVRIHLEWENGKWVAPNGDGNGNGQEGQNLEPEGSNPEASKKVEVTRMRIMEEKITALELQMGEAQNAIKGLQLKMEEQQKQEDIWRKSSEQKFEQLMGLFNINQSSQSKRKVPATKGSKSK